MKGWSQEFTYVSCVSFDNQNIVSLIQIAKYSFSWMKKVVEYSFVWINLFWNIQLSDDIVAASLSRKAMGNQIRPTLQTYDGKVANAYSCSELFYEQQQLHEKNEKVHMGRFLCIFPGQKTSLSGIHLHGTI